MSDVNKIEKQNIDVLNLFRLYKGIDRAEISRKLQLSMPTIYNSVDILTSHKMLTKNGSNVIINKKYGTLIGISIGSSLCKVSFVNYNFEIFTTEDFTEHKKILCQKINGVIEDNKLLNKCLNDNSRNYIYFKTPTTFLSLKDILNCIFDYIQNCITDNILNVLSIGISCTGIINDKSQTIMNSHNLLYLNNAALDTLILPDKRIFFENHQVYICLTQNSNASVIAEKINLYQSNSIYKQKENIISLYLGVGIGAGIYIGRLYTGSNGYAGEISHSKGLNLEKDDDIIRYNKLIADEKIDKSCTCGRDDCYDYKIRSYVFEKKAKHFCDMSSEDIRIYLTKNPLRSKLLSEYLGNIINSVTSLLNLDLIIFTGKFYKSMDLLMNDIDIIQDENPMRFSRNDCKIITSSLGALAPSIGAAIYSYHKKYDLELSWNY